MFQQIVIGLHEKFTAARPGWPAPPGPRPHREASGAAALKGAMNKTEI